MALASSSHLQTHRQLLSKVSTTGWREGVGNQQSPKYSKMLLQNCVLLLIRVHREKGAEKGLESMVWEGFLAPTPSVRQPLFETSNVTELHDRYRYRRVM